MKKNKFPLSTALIIFLALSTACAPFYEGEFQSVSGVQAPAATDLTLYVSPQGDDRADGLSPESAFATIAQALSQAPPGTTILIAPGSYPESIFLEEAGNSQAPIILRGDGQGAIFDGQRTATIGLWCENCTNLIFENLTFKDYTDIGIGVYFSSQIEMRDLTIENNGFAVQLKSWELEGYGIAIDESEDILVENNEVYRNGPNPKTTDLLMGTGINVYVCTNCVIRNNRSYNNTGGGILVEDSFNVLVEDNQIYDNDVDASIDEWWDAGIWVDGGRDIVLRGNNVYNNLGPGIEISDEDIQEPSGYVLENNRVTGNYFGLYIWNFGSPDLPDERILLLKDNEVYGNSREDISIYAWLCPPEDQPCE